MLKEVGVVEIWFSDVPCTKESAHADKENMMKNIQKYLFMSFQTGVFRMTMIRQRVQKNYYENEAYREHGKRVKSRTIMIRRQYGIIRRKDIEIWRERVISKPRTSETSKTTIRA